MRFIYSIHIVQVFSFVCVLTWSLLGVKKAWAAPRSVSFRALIQNFRRASPPLSHAEYPPPPGKGCRDLRPLIRSRCKGVLKQDNEWKGEL